MPAAATDKFRKVAPNTGWQLDASGIADASVTTFGLVSSTSLPTDTGVTLTVDRVDSSGTKTPAKMERIKGVVSGTNVISCVRGVGGTAQAHSGGAVVEIVIDSTLHNDLVDGILVEHNQDGTHKSTIPVKATGAEINTGTDDAKFATAKAIKDSIIFNAPQGFLLNGKISVTDTGSGINVAIKTLAGTDPSSTNPIYCRIGDTIRTISSALSVTKADGTNWCNAGSAELATKEIDYFVYLGYNATDGVVIGFSRIPFATQYGDFSATTTNEKYCAISTITNAASTDYYEVVGRFSATLSAGAGYTWSVPTYTAANLIQRPIYETRWLDWQPAYSANGSMTYTSVTTTLAKYMVNGKNCTMKMNISGTTGGTASSAVFATIPFTSTSVELATAAQGTNTTIITVNVFFFFASVGNRVAMTRGDWANYNLTANTAHRINNVSYEI